MKPNSTSGKISLSYFIYRLKVLTNKLLKSAHNLLYAIGIDIRIRQKEESFDAVTHNSIDEVNKYYSNTEKQFEITSVEHQKFFKEIIKILENYGVNLKDKNIADFGCGIGNLLSHLNKHFHPSACNGFDFSDTLIELAVKRFPEGSFNRHDIYSQLNRKFDFVFCTEVIEHLLYPDKAVKNIMATVRPDGVGAFISVPDGRKDTYTGHINFWSPESWEVFIKSQVYGNARIETGYVTANNLYAIVLLNSN